jgi:hypothetical protein
LNSGGWNSLPIPQKTCTGGSSIHGTGFKDKLNLCRKKPIHNSILCAIFFLRYELFHKVLLNILLKSREKGHANPISCCSKIDTSNRLHSLKNVSCQSEFTPSSRIALFLSFLAQHKPQRSFYGTSQDKGVVDDFSFS